MSEILLQLVLHDWLNLKEKERKTAIQDVRKLAEEIVKTDHRRGRSLNIIASFFYFFDKMQGVIHHE